MKVAVKIPSFFFFLLFLFLQNAKAASVISALEQSELKFGIAAVSSSGSINSAGIATGGVTSLGGFVHGSFLVTGTNNTSGSNRRSFKVFLGNNTVFLNNNGNTIRARLSLSATGNSSSRTFNFPNGSGLQTFVVEVYGTIASLTTSATAGDYSQGYNLIFCNCTSSGCPNSSSDSRCS